MLIPQHIMEIIEIIEGAGFEAFVVGGCVRDSFLGKVPSDWDITTSATPEKILEIFSDYRTIPTGLKHGTITVLNNGSAIEVTTYRIDGVYSDNRHPEIVAFSQTLEDDLSRRDFTVNAMAYNPHYGLKDLFGGQHDLENKVIRSVGNAEKRFTEDALRIMRALRFAAVLDFEIEDLTSKAILKCSPLLENIATERICSELSKLLLAPTPESILFQYKNIFTKILGISEEVSDEAWSANCKAASAAGAILPLRLTLLLDGLPIKAALNLLKYDNTTKHTAGIVSSELNTSLPADKISVKKALSALGEENFKLILKAKRAKGKEASECIDHTENLLNCVLSSNECYSLQSLAINGNDLQQAFEVNGREIGRILSALLDAVICEECENKKDALLKFAKSYLS